MRPTLVIISPAENLVRLITTHFGHRVTIRSASNTAEGERLLAESSTDVLVCQDDLPGETGIMFLARHTGDTPWLRRVLICAPLDSAIALHVINEARVFRCLIEPYSERDLLRQIEAALKEAAHARTLFNAAAENDTFRHQATRPRRLVENWIRFFPRIAFLTAITCGTVFLAGTLTLLTLYLVKTLLGIDLIPEAHLSSIWL